MTTLREFYIRMTHKFGWTKNFLAPRIQDQADETTLLGQTMRYLGWSYQQFWGPFENLKVALDGFQANMAAKQI